MKILVVDDEMVSREKMKMILSHFGECEAVENGADAVERFVSAWSSWTPFDLISLDVQMPEMDGLEVLKQIRGMEQEKGVSESRKVKVMMVTARSDKDTLLTSIESGCNDYVVKPFDTLSVSNKLAKMGFRVRLT